MFIKKKNDEITIDLKEVKAGAKTALNTGKAALSVAKTFAKAGVMVAGNSLSKFDKKVKAPNEPIVDEEPLPSEGASKDNKAGARALCAKGVGIWTELEDNVLKVTVEQFEVFPEEAYAKATLFSRKVMEIANEVNAEYIEVISAIEDNPALELFKSRLTGLHHLGLNSKVKAAWADEDKAKEEKESVDTNERILWAPGILGLLRIHDGKVTVKIIDFDVPPVASLSMAQQVSASIREAAKELNATSIEITSDLEDNFGVNLLKNEFNKKDEASH